MTCPYCNSKETISIIYLYRYNDNNTFVKKNNEEVKYSEKIRKPKRKNYDGTLITNHNHNKYCKNCPHRPLRRQRPAARAPAGGGRRPGQTGVCAA